MEIVHWHFIDERGLKEIRKQVDREDGQLLILPSDKEEVGALSDPTVNLSAANIANSSETAKESEEKDRQRYASLGLSEPRGEREQRAANERFNNELTRYQNGEMDKNEMLHLGRPQGVMRTFLPNLPIVMRQRVIKKGSEKKHEVDVSAIMNMPQHLSSPIFVFQRSEDTIGVLTDMRDRNGKNVCVAIELKRQIQQGAEYLEVNDVRSFHGREFKNIVEPIANNKTLKWVDKEKGLAYLSSASQPVQQEIDKQVLDTATKVVKDFVNPKESEGKDRQRYASLGVSRPLGEEAAEGEPRWASSSHSEQQLAERQEVNGGTTLFSLKNDRTLAGVHNITEEKLLKAIKQGGLANPSVAVIDSSKQNHDDYGDISLILPSDKVAKRTGKNAGTWQGDAWTPTYPQVERQMSNKGAEKASNDVSSVPSYMYSEVRRGLDRWLDGGEENSAMAYMFLHEKGVAPEPKKIQPKFSDEAYNELKSITAGNFNIYGIGKADARKVLDMYIDAKFDGDKDLYEEKTKAWLERNKSIVDAGANGGMRYAIAKENVELYDEYGFNYKGVQTFVRDVEYDHRKTGVDMNATLNEVEDYIKTNNLTDEFNTWMEGKEKEYGIKEVIFDGFTPSGNRRYVPNTLENVSKIMKKQGRNGSTGISVSFQNFAARLMPSYGTLKDIRSKKGLLTSDREKFDNFREKWSNVFFELGKKCQPDATGTFDDYGLARLSEAAMTSNPQAYLKKEYNVDFSDEDTKRLKEMVKAIKEESPAMYFETKFERPVHLDEFAAAVVPTTASNEVKQTLQNAGVQIFEYEKEKEGDRSRAFNEAINSSDNIRFSLDKDKGTVVSPSKPSKAEAVLRDAVIDRLRENGMEVITDVAEGQKVLDEANGRGKLQMGDAPETFAERLKLAVENRGVVMPWLNETYVEVVKDIPRHGYVGTIAEATKQAIQKAKEKYVPEGKVKVLHYDNNGAEFDYVISGNAIEICLSPKHQAKSGNKGVHLALAEHLDEVINKSVEVEEHPDYIKGKDGKRGEYINPNAIMHRFYGVAIIDGVPCRIMTLMREDARSEESNGIHSYEVQKIEMLDNELPSISNGVGTQINELSAYPLAKLLKGVEKSYDKGKKLLEESKKRSAGLREQRVYHGSGADFEAFDHRHMGEGQGSQVFGWGTYVTSSKAIGESYAESSFRTGGMEYTGDALTADEASLVGSLFISGMSSYHEVEEFLEKSANSDKPGAKRSANALALLRKTKPEEWKLPQQGKGQLYTVEIPEDNGSNYLDWENPLNDAQKEILKEGLMAAGVSVEYFKGLGFTLDSSFKYVYSASLPMMLRGVHVGKADNVKEKVSRFLSGLGFTGIKYPAGTIHGGAEKGDMNYVIFNEKDAKITDHVRFFRTANGEAYGFTVGGKIYVDPRIATSETPVHEYAHLWASALRSGNKEEWQNVVGLMKDSKVWDEVKGRYPELKTDDEIADEVIATYSGRRGAERLREEQRKIAEGDGGVFEKAEAISALEKVKRALKMFWKGVADFLHIHYKSAEEVADRVMKDLLEGVDPRSMMDGGRSLRPDTRINVVEVNSEHGFKNYAEAKTWAKEHIARTYSGEETGGKGDIRISNAAINKYLSQSAVDKSDSKDVHLSVLKVLPEVIRESVDAEQHADYKKGEDGVRSAKNGINPNVTIHRLYGAVRMDGKVYRVKVTLKEDKTSKEPKVPHSYEATKIELFAGTLGNSDNSLSPNTNNSIITAAKLLNGVEKSYGGGKFFEDYNRIRKQFIGEKGAAEADHAEEVSVRLDNLSVAREMEAEKKDAKAIKMATGWERGADGKWRYEIPDSKLNDMMDVDGKGTMVKRHEEDMLWTSGKLGNVVDAPELFKAYPELKNVRLETDTIMNDLPSNGEFSQNTNTITIHADNLKYLNSILNHEIQHAIQHIEGFANGGSSRNVRRRIQNIIDEERDASDYAKSKLKDWVSLKIAADKLENLYEKYIHSDNAVLKGKAIDAYWDAMNEVDNHADSSLENVYPDGSARDIAESGYHVEEVKKELRRLSQEAYDAIPEGNMDALHLVRKLENALEYKSDEELYHSLGGEVEARNVQERMGMSAEERRASLAAETEDVAREDQIFLMGDGVSNQQTLRNVNNQSLFDAIHTLYSKGKAFASQLFNMKYFDVAETPDFMKRLGLTGDKFTIRYGVISRHFGKDNQHDFTEEEWKQIPKALSNPILITEYYQDEQQKRQKGYRLYTPLKLADGSYAVVSAEVKNAGKNLEINAINTIFGRNAISDIHDRIIYQNPKITPEQSSLLNGNNPHQYPTGQELSAANVDNSSETAKDSEGKDRQRYASLGVSRSLGEEAAEGEPRWASSSLSEQQLDGDDTIRFSLRQEPAPKVTKKGYAVFIYKKLKNGGYKLVPKMLSNDPGAPAQTWLNADTGYMKRDENGEPLQNTNGRASVSVNGSQAGGNKSNKLAWRPGKHLAMYPNASQFKSPDGTIPKDVIFFEVEYAADPDLHKQYQRNAWELGMNDNGQYRNNQGGLPYIPKDSYYLYRTNSISEGATPMIITGAYKINRALTDAEAKELNQNAGGMWCPRKGGDLTEEKLKDMGLDDKGLKKMTESFDMDTIKESHD